MRKKLWTISAVMLFAVMTLSACTGTSSVRHRNTNTETSMLSMRINRRG